MGVESVKHRGMQKKQSRLQTWKMVMEGTFFPKKVDEEKIHKNKKDAWREVENRFIKEGEKMKATVEELHLHLMTLADDILNRRTHADIFKLKARKADPA